MIYSFQEYNGCSIRKTSAFLYSVLCFVQACAALAVEPIQLYYHEHVGIPEAERIRQAEAQGSRVAGGAPASLTDFPYFVGTCL